MNTFQKLAVGAPLKLIAGAAKRTTSKLPGRLKPVLKPPRPSPVPSKMLGAKGFIPAPKMSGGAQKNLTLAGSQRSVEAYKSMPQEIRSAIEQSDLVRSGVPPATALTLAQISTQAGRGAASGVPQSIRTPLSRFQQALSMSGDRATSAASGVRRKMPAAPTAASGTATKVGAANWNAFADELKMIMAA